MKAVVFAYHDMGCTGIPVSYTHLLMNSYRDAGPAYPTEVIDEFATITFIRDCGADNDEVINCPASELPADFPANL